MGIRDITSALLARAAMSVSGSSRGSGARESLKIGWSLPPRRTTDIWADMFHKTPMLDPVDMIASDFSAIPYKIFSKSAYRKDPINAEPYGEHPIYDLLDHPMPDHPEIDYFQLMYLTDTYFEIIGDTFWLIDRAGNTPCGVYLIPPSWMIRTPTMYTPYFRIQPMGNTSHKYFDADPEDIVWFKSPDITNPYGRGRARAEAIGDEIETHEYAAKYAKNLFYNDAVPPLILEMPGISPTEASEFKENWMQKLGGYLNAKKIAIVGKKDFKVHQLTDSPREMDFIEGRKFLVQAANEHYCAPPELRGDISNSNRATIDSALYLWTKRVISKRAVLFSSAINNQFVPMFDKSALWKYENIVPEDDQFKLTMYNAGLAAGSIMVNEWRLAHKMVAVPGGDIFLRPMALVAVPGASNTESSPTTPEEPEAPEDNEPETEDEKIDMNLVMKELESATDAITKKTMRTYSKEARAAAWKAADKRATSHEEEFKKSVKTIAKMQRTKSLIAYDKGQSFASVFDRAMDNKALSEMQSAFLASMQEGYAHAVEVMYGPQKAVPQPVTVYNPAFLKKIAEMGFEHVSGINKTTLKELQDTVAEGEAAKESTSDIKERINSVLDDLEGYRAERIARTETMSSLNEGQLITYAGEGVEKKEWLATMDDRTRDDHAEADGQVVGIDEDFDVGGVSMDAPGNSGDPGEDINCRCTILPVIDTGNEE